ncbi:MAG: PqqD family protein [Desulfobacterales bacterium]|nr:PqqD family protein [Desulfobacterales bacterium]
MKQKLIRNPKIVDRSLEDELILVNNEVDSIFNLNPIGSSVWSFLQEPRSLEEIINTLILAFPDMQERQIRTDTTNLINQLVEQELVLKVP